MFSKWNSSPASMTGRRSSITYTALPDSEFGDDRPPKRRSKCSFIKDWKFLAIFSIVTNMVTLFSLFHLIANRGEECHLGSETLWGRRVPWTKVTIENRQEFIDADPWDSKFGGDGTASAHKGPNPWDSIWFPNWVALENDPAAKGYGYGTPLSGPHSEGNEHDPIPWTEGSQAFGIGVMHQLHCVVSIKKAINDYRYTGGSRGSNSTKMTGHIDHCIEVLRQATLCHGDMALIRPNTRGKRYTGYNGWGNEHLCRDWNALTEVIRDHGIHYVVGNGMRGWTHYGSNSAT